MQTISENGVARFCWLDLAAVDATKASSFYAGMFGWQVRQKKANGGEFVQFVSGDADVASLYQLSPMHVSRGVPSHWTPYVAVSNIDEASSRAVTLGGQVVVTPFSVDGIARVSLITDAVGALLGLWEHRT